MRERLARHGWVLWTGLGLTALFIVLHTARLSEWFELLGYDFDVRYFSRIPASNRILHVDIDDDALSRVGSWPWPRDLQADLIRILHELGATRIAADIMWSEAKPPEFRVPTLDRYSDIEGTVAQVGELSGENVVWQDDELARAIEDAGAVYLSMYYGESAADQSCSSLDARIEDELHKDFGLDASTLAKDLKAPLHEVEDIMAGAKRRVAQMRVAKLLRERPAATAKEVHEALLKTPFDRLTADREDILAAYQLELSLRTMRQKCPRVPAGLAGKLPRLENIAPPVYLFTAGAKATGFVTFKPDFDGRTRRVPLLAEWDGRLIGQLGFAVACDELDIQPSDLSIRDDRLEIAARGTRRAFSVQMDDEREVLINWHVERSGWTSCFEHLPAAQLLRIADARKHLRDNELQREIITAQAMRLAKDDAAFEGYRRQVNDWIQLRRKARWAQLQGQGQLPESEKAAADADKLQKLVEADQKDTESFVDEQFKALQNDTQPADAQTAGEIKRFTQAHHLLHEQRAEIDRVNADIDAQENELMQRLRPMVQGKICFVGYTATAVADMINTPAYARVPGVLVHSSVLNSFLEGQFRSWSPRWLQLLNIAVLGAFVSIVTATRGPRMAALLVFGTLLIAYLLSATTLFYRFDTWLRLITGLALMIVLYIAILLLRFLVTDRQRRQFSKAVSQYVSPAMARRIADSADQLNLSPVSGVVTCFFSDLAGFTQVSERLGPAGTREVLNPYLDAMSVVLHQHNALINKFMGDGIFAFFNPPILPCPDHERAACEAALECLKAMDDLVKRYASHPLAAEFGKLRMRIGIATGPVFVGDYGSENKLDYTCVGDTVNLASRLEGANKFFASTIMVAGSTHDAVAESFVFRRLGRLVVKGQTVAVPVFELFGRSGRVNGDIATYREAFEAAVDSFCQRDWDAATAGFERCLQLRPEEVGAVRYLDTISKLRNTPLAADWNMGIELTEK